MFLSDENVAAGTAKRLFDDFVMKEAGIGGSIKPFAMVLEGIC